MAFAEILSKRAAGGTLADACSILSAVIKHRREGRDPELEPRHRLSWAGPQCRSKRPFLSSSWHLKVWVEALKVRVCVWLLG